MFPFCATHLYAIIFSCSNPGYSFQSFANGQCLEDITPKRPDLMILQHLPYLEPWEPYPGSNIDILLNRLQLIFQIPTLPPIIFMNMHRLVLLRSFMAMIYTMYEAILSLIYMNQNEHKIYISCLI